jgi:hypothetical protein
MPESFDPYYELLGIDKQYRPPHHYALLGLDLFESDPKKIDEAATDRMSRLQDLANSELVDHSQRLLNELSAARRCLLNFSQKAAYDEALQSRQKRAKQSATKAPAATKQEQTKRQLIIIGSSIVFLLCVATFMFSGEKSPPPEKFNLIVDWPLEAREGGTFLIDSNPHPLPVTDPMRIFVAEGRHRLMFRRPGFRNISQPIEFTGKPVRLKLQWIPVRQ